MNTSITRRAWLLAAAVTCSTLLASTAHAAIPKGWGTFEGAFFEIGVPPGFVAKPISSNGQIDAVVLVNSKLKVEFMVYSPQWSGDAPFKVAGAGEKVVSNKVKQAGKETAEDISIEARDGSYTRYVLCQAYVDEAQATHTSKAFGLKLFKGHSAEYKPLYAQWKNTLSQFAD